jgi:hypothetical protein
VFVAFGCFYLGVFQWWLYVIKFKKWFPTSAVFCEQPLKAKLANTAGKIDLAKQVLFDNFIHYTFIYFPVFYVFKESIQSGGSKDGTEEGKEEIVAERGLGEVFTTAISKYQTNFWSDNMAIWGMWIPMDAIIYSAPMWLRLPLNHGVSLLWTMCLSFMRGGGAEEITETDESK